jgi:hypothetical protein
MSSHLIIYSKDLKFESQVQCSLVEIPKFAFGVQQFEPNE